MIIHSTCLNVHVALDVSRIASEQAFSLKELQGVTAKRG